MRQDMRMQTTSQHSMMHSTTLVDRFDEAEMFRKWFKLDGIMAWFIVTGAMLVALSIVVMALLESEVVNKAGAHNRQVAFLRIAEFMGDMIGKTGGIRDVAKLQELIQDVHEIRAGVKRLSVFEITPDSSPLIFSTDPKAVPHALDLHERTEVQAGRSVMQLDESSTERGWRITAPITIDGKVVGALRGLYSVKEYDDLIKQELALSETIGIGVVIITSVTFLFLIRIKLHRPVQRLLIAMRNVESGNLSSDVSIEGPVEIKELTTQFNRMLSARRRAWSEKDRLLMEVRHFNETLQKRVADATEELQQANLELVEARIAIERSQRLAALGELSATVAHELGNPLNALSGHLQMLNHANDSSSRQRHLAIIRSEVDRMVAVIRQVLNQTRVRLRSAPLNLNSTIHEVLSLLSPGMTRRQVTFKTDLQGDLPLVAGDPNALHGLVFNLVSNAKQAMPSGGELTIRTRAACGTELPGTVVVSEGALINGTAVRLTIVDTGYGIPPEHLSRIFEPFFTTRHKHGGTGLGLAICHRVVTDSGGRLAVKSEVGQGTEFTVDLPIWKKREVRECH
ncbi:sensor histidine kinase [Candidatus Nitrospira nitrificans]|uniref:histidine kinase n=1 Tax=Candidatus Nitrospira nitrificans TaxID=1742973 RepID=A0A0S4LIC8_9BACT|nr:HAMP domain-containing sensor histidine kinase [Candidatus Nitrospira nitrificans]CUS36328.1 putative periplasmic sensor signal transduction histidine kinase [Candidatus Nitrospira nitrificans]